MSVYVCVTFLPNRNLFIIFKVVGEKICMGFQDLTAVGMHILVFEVAILCSPVMRNDVSEDHTGSIITSTLKSGSVCLSETLTTNPLQHTSIHPSIHSTIHPSIHTSSYVSRYNPFWALASLKRHLHSFLTLVRLLHPRIPRICNVSLWTTFSHLFLGFPTDFVLWHFLLTL
jgi:hypothetical protein